MIFELLEKGIVSKKKLLLEYYKKLNLTDNQALIILMIMYLNDQTRKMTTPNLLANYLNLSSVEIENELELLAEKDLTFDLLHITSSDWISISLNQIFS